MDDIIARRKAAEVILEYYDPMHCRVNTEYYPKGQMKFVILKAYAWEKARQGNYAVTIV